MTFKWPLLVPWEKSLTKARPDPTEFIGLMEHSRDEDVLRRFANLRLLEGVPQAFRAEPWNYELVRHAIALKLQISSHDITLVGSARFGFSYAEKKWPKEFTPGESDYDFFICNSALFDVAAGNAEVFIKNAGAEENKAQWGKQAEYVRSQLARQLLDHNVVPPREPYFAFAKLTAACDDISKQYEAVLRYSEIKLRVYPNWDRAMEQTISNLRANLGGLDPTKLPPSKSK